jgi:hypothetical protein
VLKRAVRSRPTDSYDDRDGPRNEVSVRACGAASSIWINGVCFTVEALIEGVFAAFLPRVCHIPGRKFGDAFS